MKRRFTINPSKRGTPVTIGDIETANSSEPLVGAGGEFNASTKRELFQTLVDLANKIDANGGGATTEEAAAEKDRQRVADREAVAAAFDSPEELSALGVELANRLSIAANRDGFMRRVLGYQSLDEGQLPFASFDVKNVTAAVATGPIVIENQLVREHEIHPPEFFITARPFIDAKEIARHGSGILERQYTNALTVTMVEEDRTWKRAADNLVGRDNPMTTIAGHLLPETFMTVVENVTRWGLPPGMALMSSSLWTSIGSQQRWADIMDPVVKNEMFMTGRLGRAHGVTLLTDFTRHPQHKVFDRGDFYVTSAMEMHGQYTDRGGLVSEPITQAETGIPGRGWTMWELMTLVIVNSRSVAKGNAQASA